ncbi:MAG: hypothetical protein U0792_23275 [Gemmataceae bacterium]
MSSPELTVYRFRVAPGSKHKTGFFVDRAATTGEMSTGLRGKRVLEHLLQHRWLRSLCEVPAATPEVVGLDLDEQAIDMAKQNA